MDRRGEKAWKRHVLRKAGQGGLGDVWAHGGALDDVRNSRHRGRKSGEPWRQQHPGSQRRPALASHPDPVAGGNARGADSTEVFAMNTATRDLVSIEAITGAAARIVGIAVKTPLVRAPFP